MRFAYNTQNVESCCGRMRENSINVRCNLFDRFKLINVRYYLSSLLLNYLVQEPAKKLLKNHHIYKDSKVFTVLF